MKKVGVGLVALAFMAIMGCAEKDNDVVARKDVVATAVLGADLTISLTALSVTAAKSGLTETFDGEGNCVRWVRLVNDKGQKIDDRLEIYDRQCALDGSTPPDEQIVASLAIRSATSNNEFIAYKADPNQPYAKLVKDTSSDIFRLTALCGHPNFDPENRSDIAAQSENHCEALLSDDGRTIKTIRDK